MFQLKFLGGFWLQIKLWKFYFGTYPSAAGGRYNYFKFGKKFREYHSK